jgi:hypothetical protein
MNGRSIEVQLMRKLLVDKFIWNAQMPNEFQDTFLPFFKQNIDETSDNLISSNALYFSKTARCYNIKEIERSDLSLPKTFQHMILDYDDQACC